VSALPTADSPPVTSVRAVHARSTDYSRLAAELDLLVRRPAIIEQPSQPRSQSRPNMKCCPGVRTRFTDSSYRRRYPAAMKFKKSVVGTAMAGAFGLAAVGFGAGQAQADEFRWWDPVPPPGQIPQLPFARPPRQWDKPAYWFNKPIRSRSSAD
jgi:hypothetical protein